VHGHWRFFFSGWKLGCLTPLVRPKGFSGFRAGIDRTGTQIAAKAKL